MKTLVFIEAPFTTKSGYGYRSYDFIRALIELYPNWNFKLAPLSWGTTSQNGLDENNEEHKILLDKVFTDNNLTRQPDIHIQITIANECRPLGKFNILVTAGIETNVVSPTWIEGVNKMNLVLVSSKHSQQSFENTSYDRMDTKSKTKLETLKLNTLIDTCFEGYDTKTFYKTDKIDLTINKLMEDKSDFNFLFVGSWLNGEIGQDRKDVGMLLYTFLDSFKYIKENTNIPSLILKTQGASPSKIDKQRILKLTNNIKKQIQDKYPEYNLPDVYIIHGDLTGSELNSLYNHPKIKSYISFTKGEGWNRTPLEFSITGKPIIISNYGGHLDYLRPQGTTLLSGELRQVHSSVVWKNVIEQHSKWFTVDYKLASNKMKDVFEKYPIYVNKARRQKSKEFTYDKMKEHIKILFDKYIPTELINPKITFNL